MSDTKKKFNETGLGKFLNKAAGVVPDVIGIAGKVLSGNVGGAIQDIAGALGEKAKDNEEARALLAEFERERMAWVLELERLDVQDRASARSREVEMAKAGRKEWVPQVLAMSILVAFGFTMYVVAFWVVPEPNKESFAHVRGIVETLIVAIVSYFYGSSAGSRRKSEQLDK